MIFFNFFLFLSSFFPLNVDSFGIFLCEYLFGGWFFPVLLFPPWFVDCVLWCALLIVIAPKSEWMCLFVFCFVVGCGTAYNIFHWHSLVPVARYDMRARTRFVWPEFTVYRNEISYPNGNFVASANGQTQEPGHLIK